MPIMELSVSRFLGLGTESIGLNMTKRIIVLASFVGFVSLLACGGGSVRNDFAGTYTGTASGTGLSKGQTGTVTLQVTPVGQTDSFFATVSLSNPTETITFTGTLNQSDEQSQSFVAVEKGGPYDGQSINCGYNPHQPTQNQTQVFCYKPGTVRQAFLVLDLNKNGSTTATTSTTTG